MASTQNAVMGTERIHDLSIKDELKKMEYEPLDATEKKLISYSLILGLSLLVILYLVSNTFFPGAHG
jgi:hypothetical protein